jgi:ribose transport system substrate-binding protein
MSGVAACGSDDEQGQSATSGEGKEQVSIAFEQVLTGVPFAVVQAAGAKAAAKADGKVSVTVSGPPTVDPTVAQKQATDLLAKRPDGFAVTPFPPELWTRTMKTLVDGTKGVVAVNVKPAGKAEDAAGSAITTFVGVNDTQQAATVAKKVIELAKLKPETTGTALVGQCVPGNAGPLYERTQGFNAVIEEELPGVKVKNFDSKVDPAANTNAWIDILKANPDPVLAVGTCDQDGTSLYKAKQRSGDDFPAGALEDPPETLKGIEDGSILATATINRYLEGYLPVRLLADNARGTRPLPKGWLDIGYTVVTKDNLAEIKTRNSSPAETEKWYASMVREFSGDLSSKLKPIEAAYQP